MHVNVYGLYYAKTRVILSMNSICSPSTDLTNKQKVEIRVSYFWLVSECVSYEGLSRTAS